MTEKLKSELPEMLKEHTAIVTALKPLIDASKKENKMEYTHFADKLILHCKERRIGSISGIRIGWRIPETKAHRIISKFRNNEMGWFHGKI